MRALTLQIPKEWEEQKGFVMREVPDPFIDLRNPADADQIIVRLHFTGVCGTDRGIWHRQAFGELIHASLRSEGKDTRVLGHEFFGEIVSLGKAAEEKGFAVGDMISAESHIVCNTCYQCTHNQKHVCTNEKILGISIDGCFAEYIKIPYSVAWKTDTSKIRPEIACMQEPFGNAVHAASKTHMEDQTVAVLGAGPIGLFYILIAKAMGAKKIITLDPHQDHLELAHAFGSEVEFQIKKDPSRSYHQEIIDMVRNETNGVGADVVIEMNGYPESINNAIRSVRRGGEIVFFGLKTGPVTIPEFDRVITRSGITMHSVIGRELFSTWELTQKLLEEKSNGIQDKLWNGLLKQGKGTILNFEDFTENIFVEAMQKNPKILLSYAKK